MIFEQFHTPGIAQLSYAFGDESAHVAAIIDPRPDVDVYLDWARAHGVVISHIFETHIHADFMSGARELAHRLGNAEIVLSAEDAGDYGFPHTPMREGDTFSFGAFCLTVRHTPGHTPEHVSLLASEDGRHETPFAVFSGDTLFMDSVGRPDLLGDDQTAELAGKLFHTIRAFYLTLPDATIVYPGHGAGSSCGPDIGDRNTSTIGYERRHNPYLQIDDEEAFVKRILGSAPPEPRHYKPLKKINRAGPEAFGQLPPAPALTAEAFANAVKSGDFWLLDTRHHLAFGGGHIPGALNIEARPELSVWAGWMIPHEATILLVTDDRAQIEDVVSLLWRCGYTRFAGYLAGGMTSWVLAGLPIRQARPVSIQELKESGCNGRQILDVRAPDEWQEGHIPNARHFFVPELRERVNELDRNRPVATYCASGFRAGIAASVLLQEDFAEVGTVPGSWGGWNSAGYPTEETQSR